MDKKAVKILISIGLILLPLAVSILGILWVDHNTPLETPLYFAIYLGALGIGIMLIFCLTMDRDQFFDSFFLGFLQLIPWAITFVSAAMNFSPDSMMGSALDDGPFILHMIHAVAPTGGILMLYCYWIAVRRPGYAHPWIFRLFVPLGIVAAGFVGFGFFKLIAYPNNIVATLCTSGAGLLGTFGGWVLYKMFGIGDGDFDRTPSTTRGNESSGKSCTENNIWHLLYGTSISRSNVSAKVTDVSVHGTISAGMMYYTSFKIYCTIEVSVKNHNSYSGSDVRRVASEVVQAMENKLRRKGVGYNIYPTIKEC